MLVLVGLGNPGEKYARHRHNVGFMAVDAIASKYSFSPWRSKFQSEVSDGFLQFKGERVKTLLLKPQTYMNDSGRAVRAAADFYKLSPNDIVVFYDELDLAPGKVKLKTGGGAAGHNGIKSIDACLGNGFRRVRIGIGHPGDKSRVLGHVLGDFAKADAAWLSETLDAIAVAAPHLQDENNAFSTQFALTLNPPDKRHAKSSQHPEEASTATKPTTVEQKEAQSASPFAEVLQSLKNITNKKDS